jgi:hypothetical protein
LVIGEHWGNLRFFQGVDTLTTRGTTRVAPTIVGWTEQGFELPFELAGDSAPALADWDDDGDLDLLIGQAHGRVHQYTNVGSAASPDWRPDGELLTLPWTDHPHPFHTFADIDGDSDEELRFLGDHAVGGDFSLTTQLPDDLPAGVYRPTLWVEAAGVPTSTDWLAAHVTYHTFGPSQASLPPIRVEQVVSFTDQRLPTPPLLPLDLPGGLLSVAIREPDGGLRDLGSEPFAQSFNRTATTRGGDLNSGTVQLEDVYSLKAASDRFRVTFDQYGHHAITMTGAVSEVWGNGYAGGGVYDIWVAEPLDIDPGVLPGTPLAVGDGFNPTLQFYPRVPAEVHLTLTSTPTPIRGRRSPTP